MKIKIALFGLILCMTSTPAISARGYKLGTPGGNSHGYHGGQNYTRPGVVIGVPGGLLLGPRYMIPASPPTVVSGVPYPVYRPEAVGTQPSICVEDRIVYGDGGQIGREEGRRFWTSHPYSVIQRVHVPCQ